MMATTVIDSERRQARSAIYTIQAIRRSVVDEVCASGKHLGEMRQSMLYDRDRAMSHIFDMPIERCVPSATTLRSTTTLRGCAAGMVLPAPGGASHASGMMRQTMVSSDEMSHISDMPIERYVPSTTTLRSATTLRGCAAGMVLPAPGGASHASGMMRPIISLGICHLRSNTIIRLITMYSTPALRIASERRYAQSAINTIQAAKPRSVVFSKTSSICKR